jgi:hypothetical protein
VSNPEPADGALLPPGAVLLHIGPYKTGSTAIQAALFAHRDVLAEHGVHYPGRWRRLYREGHALMRWAPRGIPLPPESVWDDFAADIRARQDVRICVSTEDFGRIQRRARTRKIVEDLGADRIHVLAVARAYHRLLPSHWQERVKSHESLTYDEWLHRLFEGDNTQNAYRSFWTSHDIESMTSRWLNVLPPERFTVVATDDSDRLLLSRTFERMLGLPDGLLAPHGHPNASLSMNAVEVLRRLNAEFAERGWSDIDYRSLVRDGVVRALQAAPPSPYDVPVPRLPEWVRPLVAERSRRRVEAIRDLGVTVVGDLESLLLPEQAPGDEIDFAPTTISIGAAAAAVAGAVEAALRGRAEQAKPQQRKVARPSATSPSPSPRVSQVGGRDLLRELVRRQKSRLRRSRSPAG